MTFAPSAVASAAAVLAACASSAFAGGVAPQLTVGVNVSGSAPQSVNSASGGMVGTGLYSYTGPLGSTAVGTVARLGIEGCWRETVSRRRDIRREQGEAVLELRTRAP